LTSDFPELARRLGYEFRDAALLHRALTHRSKSSANFERLEFLGDSVLSMVAADLLYDRFPQLSEGELTRLRARLVRRETLADLARGLVLGDYLELGSGELKSGGFDRDSILADALEAILGAIYKDGGLAAAQRVVARLMDPVLAAVDPRTIHKDPKTRLQEYLQKHGLPTPSYEIVTVGGEPHQQHFVVEVRVAGLSAPIRGEGGSRRSAEQEAAARACAQLGCQPDD